MVYKKLVGLNEARRAMLVYPETLANENRLVLAVKHNNNALEMHMKELTSDWYSLHKYANQHGKQIRISPHAKQMVKQQLRRLHNHGELHTNLGAHLIANNSHKNLKRDAKSGSKVHTYEPFTRQVLVNYNKDANGNIMVKQAYLTNFETIPTSATAVQEESAAEKVLSSFNAQSSPQKQHRFRAQHIAPRSLF